MAQAPSQTSSQNAILVNFSKTVSAGTLISLTASDGTVVFAFAPEAEIQSLVYSSAALKTGETYTLALGGAASSGTTTDGLTVDAAVSGSSAYAQLTISSVITSSGHNQEAAGGNAVNPNINDCWMIANCSVRVFWQNNFFWKLLFNRINLIDWHASNSICVWIQKYTQASYETKNSA
jgi:hypothetical protein